jgi:hypothetical protein
VEVIASWKARKGAGSGDGIQGGNVMKMEVVGTEGANQGSREGQTAKLSKSKTK